MKGKSAVPIFNPATPSGQMALNRFTLAFAGRHRQLEKHFARDYFERNLSHLRLCHWLTILLYSIPGILDARFFPEMKTDYRVRENHLSHFVNDGCFRCHDNEMRNEYGKYISTDCNTCHLIVAQGASEDVNELEASIAGLEFKHPEDIDGAWAEMKCTECHTPDDGY